MFQATSTKSRGFFPTFGSDLRAADASQPSAEHITRSVESRFEFSRCAAKSPSKVISNNSNSIEILVNGIQLNSRLDNERQSYRPESWLGLVIDVTSLAGGTVTVTGTP
jgi:hypothetical protein